MKNLQIFLLLILLAQMSKTEAAQFTRLFFNNADCSGFHIAYNYMNSADAPTTCASGCTEWSAGKFWVKEVCGMRVNPLFQEGFSVVRNSPGDTCTDADYSEFGALAETCILWEKTPSLKSIKMRTCPGGPDQNLMITGYNGDSCVLESSTTGYSRGCTIYSGRQGAYSVPQCPLTALPPPAAPVAPPVTPVAPPITPIAPPVAPIAAPVKAPVTPPVAPIASPVAPVTPPVVPVAAPVGSPISAPVESPVDVPVASEAPVALEFPVAPPTSVPSSGSQPFGAVKQPVSSITKVSSATKSLHYAVTVVFTSILICIGLN